MVCGCPRLGFLFIEANACLDIPNFYYKEDIVGVEKVLDASMSVLGHLHKSYKFVHMWFRVISISNLKTLPIMLDSNFFFLFLLLDDWGITNIWFIFKFVDHIQIWTYYKKKGKDFFWDVICKEHSYVMIIKPWLVLWWCLMIH